ncbi:MAG: FAD-dependent oxidoreductase [Enterobacter hormaechei]
MIGLEIAASARKRRGGHPVRAAACPVHALGERRGVAAPGSHPPRAGVEIRTGCGALELEDDGGLPVIHRDGQRGAFDAVVVGIGVDLNLELARDAG